MKRIFFVSLIVITLLGTVYTYAQTTCTNPKPVNISETTGLWKGYYTAHDDMIPFSVDFVSLDNRTLDASVTIAGKGLKKIKTKTTVPCGVDISFLFTENGVQYHFSGRPTDGKISGTLTITDEKGNSRGELFVLNQIAL